MAEPGASSIIRRQHGVISRRQALGSGMTPHEVRHLVRSSAWTRILPGVYLAADAALTWSGWAHIAVLAAGPEAVLIGETAAQLRQWTPARLPITVAIPPDRRHRLRTDALCVVRLAIPDSERIVVNGLPSTTRLRTAVDVAHLMSPTQAQPILDRMLVLDVVQLDDLRAAVEVSRRSGSAQARSLLRSASDLAAAESERHARRLLREAGITGWRANDSVTVPGGRTIKVDLALKGLRIAIEVKGWVFHSKSDRAKSDDDRVTDLQLAGWFVIPVGWLELMSDPEGFIAKVRAAIAARGAQAA